MHTLLVILGGLALLAVIHATAHWRGIARGPAFRLFVVLWAAVALANMWLGVARAGYSAIEELPILVIVFAVPCLIGWLVARRAG